MTEILKIIHYFVKADAFQFSTDINAGRADAEDAGFLEAVLGVHRPDSHSGGQRRRNHDGDDIQRPQYHLLYSSLKYKQNSFKKKYSRTPVGLNRKNYLSDW